MPHMLLCGWPWCNWTSLFELMNWWPADPQYRSMTWGEKMSYWYMKCFIDLWHLNVLQSIDELTSLSHSVKAEVRVKTVGFFTSLQDREETKLVTPWTYHLLSGPKQFRGPPESPWDKEQEHSIKKMIWFIAGSEILSGTSSFFCCSSHTLHPDRTSPPAHIMVLLTVEPHQSLRLHTLCSTTGSKACCSLSGIGPWAETEDRAAHINTSRQKAA